MTFAPRYVLGDLDLTDYPFAVYWGSDYGAPQNVAEVVDSLLSDGEIEVSDRTSNRTMTFSVLIEEADLLALAEAETTLVLECDKQRNEFLIEPGDGIAPATVFEIFRVQATFVHDDDMEWQGYRRYDLTWRALPFGRSEFETTVEALTVGAGSETTISDGTSATGWSSPDGAVTVSSGRLVLPAAASPESTETIGGVTHGTYVVDATVTVAATDFSTTPFLSFEYDDNAGYSAQVTEVRGAYADGVSLPLVSDVLLSSGSRRAVFFCGDSSVTTVRLVFANTVYTAFSHSVLLDNVKRSPRSPAASASGKESLRSIEIGGSGRTQASLQVAHATAGLGDVIVYTAPTVGRGYDPSLRQFYTGATAQIADATAVSGFKTNLDTPLPFDVPTATLPRGGYVLYARIKIDAAATAKFNWSAATRIGTTDLAPAQSGQTPPLSLDTAYRIVPIATLVLPPTDASANSAASVRITLEQDTADTCDLDQLWLFYRGEGSALSIIAAGAGTPALGSVHNRVWLDSATLSRTSPSVWVGTAEGQADALHGAGFAGEWEVPTFPPGTLGVHVVTTGAADAAVSGRYYKRWHTHAAEDS